MLGGLAPLLKGVVFCVEVGVRSMCYGVVGHTQHSHTQHSFSVHDVPKRAAMNIVASSYSWGWW